MGQMRSPIPTLLCFVVLVGVGAVWVWQSSQGLKHIETRSSAPSPPAETEVHREAAVDRGWFSDVTEACAIDFRHHSGASAAKPFPAANGSGGAALDYDLDGRYDLCFLTGRDFPLETSRSAPTNRLYRQRELWRFVDVTASSGLGSDGYSVGAAVGDLDADGFPDVYVNCYGPNRLYHSLGDGTFEELAEPAGVRDDRWGTSAAFFDYNGDGQLDLYVCNYASWTFETNPFCGDSERGIRLYCSPRSVPPEPDALYRNRGDGTFVDAADESGITGQDGRGQGVVAADLNDDGWIDLYVGNDLHANGLFLNQGNGTFRDMTETSGAGYDYLGNIQAGMGVDAADVDGDGRMDLFVTNFEKEHNAFYQNTGNGLFLEVAHQFGLASASIPWVGWGTSLTDFNLDGQTDVLVTNGHVDDNRHLLGQDAPYEQPPLLWSNSGGHFDCLGPAAGDYFARDACGRGLMCADLDNDGDLDVVITHQDDRPTLLRNNRLSPELERSAASIRLRLIGVKCNRDAVGSRISFWNGERRLVQQVKGGGSYLSAHDLRQVLTVAADAGPIDVEIRWPLGRNSEIRGLMPGGRYIVREPHGESGDSSVFALREPR